MEQANYLKDISDIKNMMSRSSRFLSISGLSGVLAGIYALIGAYLSYEIIYENYEISAKGYRTVILTETKMLHVFAIATIVVILSIATGIIFSYLKAKKQDESFWDATSKRLVINFLIPLVTGGFFILF